MSINQAWTFFSLKTSFLFIFCKNKCWDKIDQKLEYDGGSGKLRTCNVVDSFSTCNIFLLNTPLKRPLFYIFKSFLC